MKSEPHDDPKLCEPTINMHDTCSLNGHNSSAFGSGCYSNASCEGNVTAEQHEVVRSTLSTPYVYRQDVVKHRDSGMIGIVTEVAGDSDSDSSITDDEDEDDDNDAGENEERGNDGEGTGNESGDMNRSGGNYKAAPLPADQVRVLWMDESETTQNLTDVAVVDRSFLHGDFVAAASDSTGQVGVVVEVNIFVDLLTHDGATITDVSTKDLQRVRDFTVGDYVILGPWLGRIDDVLDNVTVLFDDGSVCKVMKADPLRLKPVAKDILEDGHFPYYPGQRVRASSSSVFRNSRWLSGIWKANRLEGTVTKVTVGSVFIYWIASAGYGPDSSTAPAEEQSPKNLKLLSRFAHANWQLGDWCILPSAASSSISLDADLSNLELHDLETTKPEESIGSSASTQSSSCSSSSLSVSKEPIHESWPLHRKKIRKVVVKREKKARKKEENFERAVMIVNTKTRVDVAWQDGKEERGVESTTLVPIDSPGDHEFVAEQYVVEKASDDNDYASEVRRVGVVKSVNAKERTAWVRWLKPVCSAEEPRVFDKEEIVSVYELEGHADYDYCYGDVVVRLSPVPVAAQTASPGKSVGEPKQESGSSEDQQDASGVEACTDFSSLSWVGNITGLKDGDIEVTWADGMVSTVGPQAVFVVGRDDDDESVVAGSDISDGAASWETVNDDEMDVLHNSMEEDEQQFDINPETVDSNVVRENNSGRNGALAIPLAALGFVTRLASGMFSRGRKHIDPSCLDPRGESELQSQGKTEFPEKRTSGDESSSQESEGSNCCAMSTTMNGNEVDDDTEEAPHLLDTADALCNFRNIELDGPSCDEDSACSFKSFDIVKDPLDHHYLDSNGQNNNGRKWLKKVQQDWVILQNNLPDGINVRVYEDRMDLLRAVIAGAYGTPYQDGLFFFDFHLPPEYPNVPPSAYYHSGGWRINPNLYEEGKVCLSLLNTWTGRGNEVWDQVSSSILQVLVSLQGLVLNSKPYFNEAGYDKQIGTAEGEKNSLSYNENTFLLNCKTMMYLIRKPPKDFEELVKEHFRKRGHYILKACDAYMRGYLIGSLKKDASPSMKSVANATSVGFKLMLSKIAPKLFMALNDIGADCQEFKHLQQS